ncbi:MAG TPA: segregation/condensation protein A [Candidatus Limnocylindrales bacterium]
MAPDGTSAIRFGEARRPESATLVRVEGFDGPLGLLVSLIEARQLDVLTVRLGDLAEAYLEALSTLAGDRIANVSAFVSIASQLILIKSRALLPRRVEGPAAALDDEGVDPEAELRARLLLYRAHRDAGRRLADDALARIGLFRREPGIAHAAGLAGARSADATPLDPQLLVHALDGIARVVPPPDLPPEVVPRTITLAERAAVIRSALAEAPVVVLQELLRGIRDRVLVAVTFLALLELMKRREVVVEQAEPWGPIVARRFEGAAVSADTPIDESLESFA